MSIVRCNEIPEGRGGTSNNKFERTHTRAFRVITDNASDDDYDVLVGSLTATPDPVPPVYEIHPSDSAAYVQNHDVKQDSEPDGNGWIITVSYTNQIDPGQNNPDPLQREPVISWSFAQFQTIAEQDRDEKALTNTLKQVFDPPVEKDASNIVLTYTRYESGFNPSLAIQYQDSVNDAAFLGAPAGTAKLQSIGARQHHENGETYYETTYEIHFRREGWAKRILNRGTKFKATAGSTVLLETVDREPVNLKEDGTKVTPGSTVGIHYVTANVYAEEDFDNLNIVI